MQQKNEFSEENQGSGSEIIQRLEKEKKAAEELALNIKRILRKSVEDKGIDRWLKLCSVPKFGM